MAGNRNERHREVRHCINPAASKLCPERLCKNQIKYFGGAVGCHVGRAHKRGAGAQNVSSI